MTENHATEPRHRAHEAAHTDEQLEARFNEHTPRTAWRILARNQARILFDLVREIESSEPPLTAEQKADARLIRECIGRAVWAASWKPHRIRDVVKDWYSGASIETAWSELHSASERLLLIQPAGRVLARVSDINAALRSNLKADDPRLSVATAWLSTLATKTPSDITPEDRDQLVAYQRIADIAGDEAHENVRSFRNLLIAVGASITVALVALGVLHAVDPHFIDLATTHAGPHADAVELWQVELVGALGGLIAAVFTVAKLGGFGGPYRLPAYQALIRVPAGAAVSIAAVVLVQSGQVKELNGQTGLGILAVALVFGYSPDILLRLMDQKATAVLGQAQSKDDPGRPPLANP